MKQFDFTTMVPQVKFFGRIDDTKKTYVGILFPT